MGERYNASLASEYAGALVTDETALGACLAQFYANSLKPTCSPAEIISSVNAYPPNFLPWAAPVYSDLNFMLLGLAISSITNKTLTEVYSSAVFRPLNMTSSSDKSENKTLSRAVVIGTPDSYAALDAFPFTAPSGGLLSTVGDLQKLGLGILNSTLLPKEATAKWLKPVSLTASLSYAIGAPWEIHRFVHPTSGKVTDIYTKLGDSGSYGGALAIIPQYNAGFALLNAAAGPERSDVVLGILDAITATVLPALEAQALAEAKCSFIGEYKSSGGGGGVEATIKIGHNASSTSTGSTDVHSDLVVTEWVYNGTDVLMSPLFGGAPLRLEQSIVRPGKDGKPRQIAFVLSSYKQTPSYTAAKMGSWMGLYHSDGDFTFTDKLRWGGQDSRRLVFDVDEHGAAVKCTPSYQKIALTRSKK